MVVTTYPPKEPTEGSNPGVGGLGGAHFRIAVLPYVTTSLRPAGGPDLILSRLESGRFAASGPEIGQIPIGKPQKQPLGRPSAGKIEL